jgi:hypothetical protein
MVKVIRLADDGTELAAVEVDDFTIEILYSGIAEMLRDAAAPIEGASIAASCDLPPAARARREKILTRIRD